MIEFWTTLWAPEFHFLRFAYLMGLMASFTFGAIGTYVVVNRISYIAGAIAHAILGGVGLALYAQHNLGISGFHPIYGALLAAIVAALLINWIKYRSFEREDSVIGAVWASGMAVGLIFFTQLPPYVNPMSYLFGSILLLSKVNLLWVCLLNGLLLTVLIFSYKKLQAVSYDPEFCELRGMSPMFFNGLLLCLVALSIVLLVNLVGVVLVVALLTIPAAMASRFSHSMKWIMLVSSLLSLFFIWSGLFVGYSLNWPMGPSIILVAGACYLTFFFVSQIKSRR